MRERLNLSRDEIQKYLEENPFLLIRGPLDVKETSIIIAAKLFTRGAATSLRRTSAAIYLGRLSAFESARAWKIMESGEDDGRETIRMTFKEYISQIMESMKAKSHETSLRDYKTLIFPQHNSYEVVRSYVRVHGIRKPMTKILSQSVRTWTLNNFNYNFSASLKAMLETSFGISQTAPMEEVRELRKFIPFDLSGYQEFIDDCNSKGVRPLDIFFYMQSFYKNSQTKRAQVFATGPSTTSLNLTLSNIKRYNHLSGSIMDIDPRLDDTIRDAENSMFRDQETLKLAFNMRMLETQNAVHSTESILDSIFDGEVTYRSKVETILRNFKSIRSFDNQTKKMIMLLSSSVLSASEFKSKLLDWKQLSFTYLKQQKKNQHGNWVGDLKVLVHYMNECYMIHSQSGYHYIETNRIIDNHDFFVSFNSILRILEIPKEYFTQLRDLKYGDPYLMPKGMFFARGSMRSKSRLNFQFNHNFQFVRLNDLAEFKIVTTVNKSGATVLTLQSRDRGSINVSHFPGHYHPVEIPRTTKFKPDVFINGLRATKLFKNRKWFFDGRLHPFTTRESVDILKNHLLPEKMQKISDDNTARIQDFLEDFEINAGETFEINDEPANRPLTEPLLLQDFDNQMSISLKGKSIMEMFQMAADKLAGEDWSPGASQEIDPDAFDERSEDIIGFVKALGENTQKKKRDFYTITNLKLNQSFILRVLDLFFKHSNILSEDKRDLPDYAQHVMSVMQNETDVNRLYLLDQLMKYIINRISTITGSEANGVYTTLTRMFSKGRKFNTLRRLTKFLEEQNDETSFFDMLGYESDQASDSEGDFD
jgi:hypothetical protein